MAPGETTTRTERAGPKSKKSTAASAVL